MKKRGVYQFIFIVGLILIMLGCSVTSEQSEIDDSMNSNSGVVKSSRLNISYSQIAGPKAIDIGIGKNGSVLILGDYGNPHPSYGSAIYTWNGSGWDKRQGLAVRIDVDPNGRPWVVNKKGNTYRDTGAGWQSLPGLAKDITIGEDFIGYKLNDDNGFEGFTVKEWWEPGSVWATKWWWALKLSSSKGGTLWAYNKYYDVRNTHNATSQWSYGFGRFSSAIDIGAGYSSSQPGGGVWIATKHSGYSYLYRWNGIQPDPYASPQKNKERCWEGFRINGIEIISLDADQNGNPWFIDKNGRIFKGTFIP